MKINQVYLQLHYNYLYYYSQDICLVVNMVAVQYMLVLHQLIVHLYTHSLLYHFQHILIHTVHHMNIHLEEIHLNNTHI